MDPLKVILVGCDESVYGQLANGWRGYPVKLAAEFDDARGAVDSVRLSQNEKCLCIVHLKGAEEVQQLKLLSNTFVGRPVLALLDAESDPELFLTANRAGADQVVPLPVESEDLRAALDCISLRYAPMTPVSARRVLAVSGVTGGCGTTTIAVNLAYEVSHLLDLSCILVELSTQLGMVAICLNVEPRYTTSDLFCDMKSVDVGIVEKTLTTITDKFRVLAAPNRETEPFAVASADIAHIIDCAKSLADVVILDIPSNHHDFHLETFAGTDQIVLVAEQAIPSLRALSYVREKLDQPNATGRQTLVINRYNPHKAGFSVSHLQRLLETPQLLTIANDYQGVSGAINEGRPLRLHAPRSPALTDIDNLARALLLPQDQPAAKSTRPRSYFGRLVHAVAGL